jgi:glycosyltransferase involved in cell wall biosynthesis
MTGATDRAPGPPISVVIPAHNEAATLPRLLVGLREPGLDVVVVCNGSTDGSAEVARALAPDAKVLEIDTASKVAALAAGDAVATAFPRFYVDADVGVDARVLRRLSSRLDAGPDAVAPAVRYDTGHSSWPVRAYYRVLPLLPAVSTSIAGTGCIGLSESGRSRFGDWPDVLADDYFVDGLFEVGEKERVRDVASVVVAPFSVGDLVARRVRVIWANRQVDSRGLRRVPVARAAGTAGVLRRHPARVLDVAVFTAVALWVRIRVRSTHRRGETVAWGRDRSRERAG